MKWECHQTARKLLLLVPVYRKWHLEFQPYPQLM